MGFKIHTTDPTVLEVHYVGPTNYADRAQALREAGDLLTRNGMRRLLVDFSKAQFASEGDGARLDFVATAITAKGLEGCRIALTGGTADYAYPAEVAGQIRGIKVRAFQDRESALQWLTNS